MQKAVIWLSRRSLSRQDIRKRLSRLGASEEIIEAIFERLQDLGYIDDARFARSFTKYRKETSSVGSLRMIQELTLRGISREESLDIVNEVMPPDEEYARARRIAIKKIHDWQMAVNECCLKAKLGRHLQQKGFPLELIYCLLDEIKQEVSSE